MTQLDLTEQWSAPAAAAHREEIARLIPLCIELGRKAGLAGVTVADLRITAVQRGYLTGQERGRHLSYLGAVMKEAGLVKTGEYRRSHIEKSHGNLHTVYILP